MSLYDARTHKQSAVVSNLGRKTFFKISRLFLNLKKKKKKHFLCVGCEEKEDIYIET